MDIDFVITWVDMNDPEWQANFMKYSGRKENTKNGVSEARFRDYGFLKYWFRGVEKFAPWVRKIHFVTSGQKPEWLDANHPKIHLVNHKDYIPEQFLPTYNSVVIERYLHKIPGLAEHFVYFNDDFYIINTIGQERGVIRFDLRNVDNKRYLVTDADPDFTIHYHANNVGLELVPPLVCQGLEYMIASKLAPEFVKGDVGHGQGMDYLQLSNELLTRAWQNDLAQGAYSLKSVQVPSAIKVRM